ncbi:J domain-containing protein [candidate division KSB1 bacterium]|nr:J domain-containing protein [candidate division KSB1 bacterium]
MQRSTPQLKRKLRQLKQLELKIRRFGDRSVPENPMLIWDAFFSTKLNPENSEIRAPASRAPVKYPFAQLLCMSRQALKDAFEEYFYHVYIQAYKENGISLPDVYDPRLLSLLGLPAHSSLEDIKRRFRELAKRYHPDHGGDSEKFIELMQIIKQLRGG